MRSSRISSINSSNASLPPNTKRPQPPQNKHSPEYVGSLVYEVYRGLADFLSSKSSTWTPYVCGIMAFWAVSRAFGLLFYILL